MEDLLELAILKGLRKEVHGFYPNLSSLVTIELGHRILEW